MASGWILAFDTGSPEVSVALGRPPEVVAWRSIEQASSGELLIRRIDDLLTEAGIGRAELSGIVALQGPGSFTGLRVGLATDMGLHQALEVPTTTLPTLEVLASIVPADGQHVLALVDALRDDWSAQLFLATEPVQRLGPPAIEPGAALHHHDPEMVIGFGTDRLADQWSGAAAPTFPVPGPLAPAALRLLAIRPLVWNPARLTEPLYLRAAAAVPVPRRGRRAHGADR